jgi:hypothetical protein
MAIKPKPSGRTAPVANPTLRGFYDQVRPLGGWPRVWTSADRTEHQPDKLRLGVALGWQRLTFLILMGMILGLWHSFLPALTLWAGLFAYLIRDLRRSERAALAHLNP